MARCLTILINLKDEIHIKQRAYFIKLLYTPTQNT